jgi:hypothetical protein
LAALVHPLRHLQHLGLAVVQHQQQQPEGLAHLLVPLVASALA